MSASPQNAVAAHAPNVRTLRSLLVERARAQGRFRIAEVVAILVPICTDLAARHSRGETLYVHASSIGAGPDGVPRLIADLARTRPTSGPDAAAIAPELLAGGATTPRSSVFALGALVYEMLTMTPIGPTMKPPSALVPGLAPIVDTILAKALVADPAARPDDLPAFAQAIHHFAPESIAPPPAVEESFDLDIDIRTSMLPTGPMAVIPKPPPTPRIDANYDPFAVDSRDSDPVSISRNRQTEELSALKARLEADPAPRWVVVKDKMDHGPFAAIELLQQIVSNTFEPDDILVDTHKNTRTPIKDHAEFGRFAHHAELKRDSIREAAAVVVAEKREKATGATTTIIGIAAVVAVIAVGAVIALKIKGNHDEEERQRQAQGNESLKGEGNVAAASKNKPKPKWNGQGGAGGGGGGGGSGADYESALKNSVSDMDAETLSSSECGNPIGQSIPLGCGLTGKVWIKVAIQHGKLLGATVTTDPDQPGVNSCIQGRVRGLSWRDVGGVSTCTRTFK